MGQGLGFSGPSVLRDRGNEATPILSVEALYNAAAPKGGSVWREVD